MPAKDLITIARAKQAILSLTDNSQDALLATLITAASDAIASYCRRDFYARHYDELYSGTGQARLMLRAYPIQAVTSVRHRPVGVLAISNRDLGLNQQARVQVTSTGLKLTRMAAGVLATDNLTYSSNPTLQDLADAINALGQGWQARVTADYGKWPSADLYCPPSFGDGVTSQGSFNARGQFADLHMHTAELSGYQFEPRGWLVRTMPFTDPELMHPEDMLWPVGTHNFRIQYTAGYTTIPEAVQQAAALWTAAMYYAATRDPSVRQQSLGGGGSMSFAGSDEAARPPGPVQALLAPYRRHVL